MQRWIEAERDRFILLLPIAMGAAILLYFALPTDPPLWLGPTLATASAPALALAWRIPPARLIAALALSASLGFTRAEFRTSALPPLAIIPQGATSLTGTITAIALLPTGRRLTLAQPSLDNAPILRDIRLRLRPDDATPLTPGAKIQTYALLFGPDRPAYPGGWDQGRQYFFQNLAATGIALGPVSMLTPAPPNAWAAALQTLRTRIEARILATLPVATGSIAATLLTGDEQAIPEPERENFIAAGLAHILAVAGLHVGIVMGIFFFTSRYLLTRNERLALRLPVKPIAAIIALLAGAAYAALTGAHLPILRSLAMASLATAGIIIGRRAISLRGLGLAAMVLLLATPEAIIGTSFQMSFSAVLALISGFAAIRPLNHRRGFLAHILALAYTSLLAGGASMPFAAYQFQQLQPYWIPANLIAVPLTAFWIMPWGLAALALMPVHLAPLALIPMSWGIAIIVNCTSLIAAWPHAILRIAPVPSAAMLFYAAGLIWLCIWRTRARLAGLPLMLTALIIALAALPPDVLVSADARLIAIRQGTEIFLIRQPKSSNFILAQWSPVWAGHAFTPAQCTSTLCRLGPILFATTPPKDCAGAALAISPAPLRGACGAIPAIDRTFVFYNGAAAAWLHGAHVTLRTDREAQGARPWVIPYPQKTTLR